MLQMKSDHHQSCSLVAKMSNEIKYHFKGWDVSLHFDGRKSQIMFNLIDNYPQNCIVASTSTWKNLCDNKLHHIVVNYDSKRLSSKIRIFIDGIERMVKILNDTLTKETGNSFPITIGSRHNGHFNFNGSISNVHIFLRQLNTDEIAKITSVLSHISEPEITKQDLRKKTTVLSLKNVSHSFKIYHEKKIDVFSKLKSIITQNNKYEELKVLENISMELQEGEVLGILGRNGSGKTTLLKIIGQIIHPSSGIIQTSGKVSSFLSLGAGLNPDLTTKQNIILYGMILGESKRNMEDKVDFAIRFAELEKFADVKIKDFSTGMLMKLAFSTALCVNPDILLIDEVISVGDYIFQQKSLDAFLNIKKSGKSIIFVSHSLEQVDSFCDKAILIEKGKIVASGIPADVIDRYIQSLENN